MKRYRVYEKGQPSTFTLITLMASCTDKACELAAAKLGCSMDLLTAELY